MDSTFVRRDSFTDFVVDVEPRLRRALVAGYGVDRGREASVDALVDAWRKWDRVQGLANPAGYLYRVGERIAKKPTKRHGLLMLFAAPEAMLRFRGRDEASVVDSLRTLDRVSTS
jgi:DNA-directed RNA polymerase specialized sigma24 family protein